MLTIKTKYLLILCTLVKDQLAPANASDASILKKRLSGRCALSVVAVSMYMTIISEYLARNAYH